MTVTMKELRQLIADNCDFSQPLHVVAHDVGKKAAKHSVVRADANFPVRLSITPGKYDERGVFELAHYADAEVLMPETVLNALDELLKEVPKATVGWVYFFYFPLDQITFLGKQKRIDCSLLDTSKVRNIYLAEDEPNTLIVEGEYTFGSFNM